MSAAARRFDTAPIVSEDGASARLEQRPHGEALTVRDRAGRLLFEYDAQSGRGTLLVPDGDLRLCAPRGAVEIVARDGIRASSGGELSLSAATSATLSAGLGDTESSLRLEDGCAALQSEQLSVRAASSDLHLGDARAVASSLHAKVDRAELAFVEVVRSAERVIDEAATMYQRVSDLYELKAGRLRALLRESLWMKGQDVTLLAKKDVRIDGEHINLG